MISPSKYDIGDKFFTDKLHRGLTMDDITSARMPKTKISAEERARRKAAIDYGRGSVRLEGFVVSEFAEQMNRRYIDGEITREELTAAILAHHQL
jgi:hypothetical protein